MKMINKDEFLKNSTETLGEIFQMLDKLPSIKLSDMPAGSTSLVIVDMINGFTREGALKSSRIEALIPEISEMSKRCDQLGIIKLAFADCHRNASPEFDVYPAHCLMGTNEGDVVDEIKEVGGYKLIAKNSTNGYLESEFQKWLKENQQINTFIITGNCTDICVQQFAMTLKTWFNMIDQKVRIVVPVNMVETYDLGMHNGDLMNIMALYSLLGGGIEVVKKVEMGD